MPKTVQDLENTFRCHYRNNQGEVVMRFHAGGAPHIMSVEEHEKLREAVMQKVALIVAGVEEPDPISQFAVMVLANSY